MLQHLENGNTSRKCQKIKKELGNLENAFVLKMLKIKQKSLIMLENLVDTGKSRKYSTGAASLVSLLPSHSFLPGVYPCVFVSHYFHAKTLITFVDFWLAGSWCWWTTVGGSPNCSSYLATTTQSFRWWILNLITLLVDWLFWRLSTNITFT